MLRLQRISLFQFKNYSKRTFEFPRRITAICGNNGAGKTNLLDAIYYLCFTRSYFTRTDLVNIIHGHTGFRIEGDFVVQDKYEKAVCILRETGKKEFSVNDRDYDKFSQHIGRYPCVFIAPDDAGLITGGSEERRKFMDSLLSQLDADYLQQLITYTRLLQQRNSLLRSFYESGNRNLSLLEVLDEQMAGPAHYIFRKRSEFVEAFLPMANRLYTEIAGKQDAIEMTYISDLRNAAPTELLKANRQKDLQLQRTCSGIHRDEIGILLAGQPFKTIASQGQRKSLLFALKLAEMETLESEKGCTPLLLLDDVFEKLDEERTGNLLHKVCQVYKGQIFITDTNEERLRSHMADMGVDFDIIRL